MAISRTANADAEIGDGAVPATPVSQSLATPSEQLMDGRPISCDSTGSGMPSTDLAYRLLAPMTAKEFVTGQECEEEAPFARLPETLNDAASTKDAPGAAATQTVSKWRREYEERQRLRAWHAEQRFQAYQRTLDLQSHVDRMYGTFDTIVPDLRDMMRPRPEASVLDMRGPMVRAFEYQRQLQRRLEEEGGEVAPETPDVGGNRYRCIRCGLVNDDFAALQKHGEAIHKQSSCVEDAPIVRTTAPRM